MKRIVVLIMAMVCLVSLAGCFSIEDYLKVEETAVIVDNATSKPMATSTTNPVLTPVPTDTPKPTAVPTATPVPTPTLEPTPAPKLEATLGAAQITIIEGKYSNHLRIAIPLTNTGNINMYVFDSGIDLEDSQGNLIDTFNDIYVSFYPSVLKPGETGYYYYYSSYDKEVRNDLVAITKPSVTAATIDYIRYDVSKVSINNYGSSGYEVIGKATNNTGVAQKDSLKVIFFAFDSNDNILDIDYDYCEKMAVGDTQSFKISSYDGIMPSDIARYEIVATTSDFQLNW